MLRRLSFRRLTKDRPREIAARHPAAAQGCGWIAATHALLLFLSQRPGFLIGTVTFGAMAALLGRANRDIRRGGRR